MKLKKSVKRIIIVIVCILVVVLLMVGMYFYGLTSVSKTSEKVKFNIESGSGKKEIVNDLYKSKLIKSKIATLVYLTLNRNIIIQAGTYELDRSLDTKEIFDLLNKGSVVKNTVTLTFVEGKRVTDYVKLIHDKLGYSEDDIYKVMNDQEYLKELINKYDFLDDSILNSDIYYPLEGYLFPSTYEFYKDESIKSILEKMLAKSGEVLDNYSAAINASKYNVHEILTMASIIENETMVKEDRPIVSQVIYKRLDMNMALGMDVTAYYGARKALSEDLSTSDLNSKNAYNTRNTSFVGLPVGPICNPSEDSIKAVFNPSSTSYVYFYADKDGKLHFASTNAEFQDLIRQYS